ncbi:MAG TPA: DNA-processing protein DprA, partial [Caldimonas sp.]|nr:DNA-processing protein DprA [Caldimonas sp.]
MIDREEFSAWLRLLETPGVGREAARALLGSFGSPEGVLGASTAARKGVVPPGPAEALAHIPQEFPARLAAASQWLTSGEEPRDVITLGDPRYPALLLDSPDPPLLLYVRGRIDLLERPALAIVGSRNATAQGLDNARAFAAHRGGAGWVVVSGLALGIDGAAHEGAIASGGGTIAV